MSKLLSFVLFWEGGGGHPPQAPTLPDPSELFLPSLEVVHIYPLIDNDNRTLYVYHDGEWQTVPFPADLTGLYSPLGQPDGSTLMLSETTVEDNFREASVWRLADDGDGYQLRLIETPCDAGERSLEKPWGVFTAEDGSMSLCNVLTGETSPPLPDGAQITYHGGIPLPLAASPDGRYIIVHAYVENIVYAYDRSDQIFWRVGQRRYFDDILSDTVWVTPTIFYFETTNMPEWSARNVYVGDASQPNSLHIALSKWRFYPRWMDDPMGFQAMNANMGDGPTPGPCTVTIYRFDQQTVETYDTGSLCDYGTPIPNSGGDQLFRAIRTTITTAALVRYNPFTGERRNLMVGEIEALGAVSPDGRYALVGMGRSGAVETDQDPDINFGTMVEPDYNLLVDLNTGEAVGELPTGASWLSPSHLLADTTLYTLENGVLTERALPDVLYYGLNERAQIIVSTPDHQVALYDAASGDLIPFVALQPGDGFSMGPSSLSDEVWRVSILNTDVLLLTADVRLP